MIQSVSYVCLFVCWLDRDIQIIMFSTSLVRNTTRTIWVALGINLKVYLILCLRIFKHKHKHTKGVIVSKQLSFSDKQTDWQPVKSSNFFFAWPFVKTWQNVSNRKILDAFHNQHPFIFVFIV